MKGSTSCRPSPVESPHWISYQQQSQSKQTVAAWLCYWCCSRCRCAWKTQWASGAALASGSESQGRQPSPRWSASRCCCCCCCLQLPARASRPRAFTSGSSSPRKNAALMSVKKGCKDAEWNGDRDANEKTKGLKAAGGGSNYWPDSYVRGVTAPLPFLVQYSQKSSRACLSPKSRCNSFCVASSSMCSCRTSFMA